MVKNKINKSKIKLGHKNVSFMGIYFAEKSLQKS